MNQNNYYLKTFNRIRKKARDWFKVLQQEADDEKLIEALDMFRYLTDIAMFQYKTNKMQRASDINKVYETLKDILKGLEFDEIEIKELMSLIKSLDVEHLRKLLLILGREFDRLTKDTMTYLKELEEYNEEELGVYNEEYNEEELED